MNEPQLFNIDIDHARALGDLVEAVYPQEPANQRRGHGVLTYLGPTTTSTEHIRLSEVSMVAIVSGALVDDPDLSTKYVHVVDHIGIEHHISVPDVVEALVEGRARIEPPAVSENSSAEVTVKLFSSPRNQGVGVRVYDEQGSLQCRIEPADSTDAQRALRHLSESAIATRYIDKHLEMTPGHR